ncbi:hypothetical protein HELRODRAFT_170347 [Helobdella robusta]|uniref:Uncharacterized protein n=1 Tax=Helobdella robusta TaxID=6412 RepID=T1F2Y5_HELRO|nr:hypothetical protein HELRODRAFT_170347 [Helobdella robusta]ESO07794.1 hypothetical protein HELRODRAFT_170347 [Helobdella robusta]
MATAARGASTTGIRKRNALGFACISKPQNFHVNNNHCLPTSNSRKLTLRDQDEKEWNVSALVAEDKIRLLRLPPDIITLFLLTNVIVSRYQKWSHIDGITSGLLNRRYHKWSLK